jgi:Caenorhabditis protein of unknown function, DUF268
MSEGSLHQDPNVVPCLIMFRYGDMLNPWGDLITMARAWCLVKPGGLGLVGVPTGMDQVRGNP